MSADSQWTTECCTAEDRIHHNHRCEAQILHKYKANFYFSVRFEVSTAVTMMIIIFWEMTPWGSYKSLCLYKSLRLRSVTCSHSRTLKMEAIRSSETSVLVRATRCHLPEDDNLLLLSSNCKVTLVPGDQFTKSNLLKTSGNIISAISSSLLKT
jgi:hypothetical protein